MKVLMKTPSDCPFCGEPLLNEFGETVDGAIYVTKTCSKKLDHKIEIRACKGNDDYIDWIRIPYSQNANTLWYMGSGTLIINSWRFGDAPYAKDLKLPFFEPDLSDYKKLINKIKIYVLFS